MRHPPARRRRVLRRCRLHSTPTSRPPCCLPRVEAPVKAPPLHASAAAPPRVSGGHGYGRKGLPRHSRRYAAAYGEGLPLVLARRASSPSEAALPPRAASPGCLPAQRDCLPVTNGGRAPPKARRAASPPCPATRCGRAAAGHMGRYRGRLAAAAGYAQAGYAPADSPFGCLAGCAPCVTQVHGCCVAYSWIGLCYTGTWLRAGPCVGAVCLCEG